MTSVSSLSEESGAQVSTLKAEAPAYTQEDLEAMTKVELVELASTLGIEVYSSWTKAVIIETILANL